MAQIGSDGITNANEIDSGLPDATWARDPAQKCRPLASANPDYGQCGSGHWSRMRSLAVVTRRDFTKLARLAAGTLFVPSREGAQEKQTRQSANPAAVTSGFVQNAGAESTTNAPAAVQQSCLPTDLGEIIFPGGSRFPPFHLAIPASLLLIAGFYPPALRPGAASPRRIGPLTFPTSFHDPVMSARPGSVVVLISPVVLFCSVKTGR
jgi:hypothetical protein